MNTQPHLNYEEGPVIPEAVVQQIKGIFQKAEAKEKRRAARKKPFVPLHHRETSHYRDQFQDFLKEKLGKQYAEAVMDLFVLEWMQDHPLNETGQKFVKDARRHLQRFLKKYDPTAD